MQVELFALGFFQKEFFSFSAKQQTLMSMKSIREFSHSENGWELSKTRFSKSTPLLRLLFARKKSPNFLTLGNFFARQFVREKTGR